jgi:murein DD-endopeptidase MepM/ murein hydrolase activator NlpD
MGRHRHEAATDAMVYQGMREATASADRRAADLAAAARRHATDLAAAEQRHADALGGERKRYDALAEATAELAGLLETSVETRVEPVRRMLASVGFEGATLGRVLRNAPAAGGPFVPLPRGATDLAERLPEQASARLRAAFDGMLSLGTLCHLAERIPAGMPVSATGTSSGFGRRIDPFTGQQALHTGVDLNAPTGTPVTTRAPGRVSDVSRHPEYGLFVDVDHGYGILTRYAHLSTALVRKGSPVEAGNTIGLVGLTGRTTGEHLHYEVVLGGRPVDPVSYLGARRHVCETR